MGVPVHAINDQYQDYLHDESGFTGQAESISFPKDEDEVIEVIRQMKNIRMPITIQGGKTGIVGSGVPGGGHILNLTRMNKVKAFEISPDNRYLLTVEAGITLLEIQKYILSLFKNKKLFWPPSPTEGTATIGGIAASSAAGIHRACYGETAGFIEHAVVISSDGNRHNWDKQMVKEYLVGSEGMIGVITEITLELLELPEEIWAVTFFFEEQEAMLAFCEACAGLEPDKDAFIAALEFMDKNTIDLIENYKKVMSKIKDIPEVKSSVVGLVYIELFGTGDAVEILAQTLMELSIDCGSDCDDTWAVSGAMEIGRMRDFRHAAAEASNLRVETVRQSGVSVTKLGTDISYAGAGFARTAGYYLKEIAQSPVSGCIFGHVKDNHFHINLFPQSAAEYETAKALIEKWTGHILAQGGQMSTEHGIGKLKRALYLKLAKREEIEQVKSNKQRWDPEGLWNPDNRI